MGLCIHSSFVTESDCPFGDDLVQNGTHGITFSSGFVNCSKYIEILQEQGKSKASFCTTLTGIDKCCSTCLSKQK